MKRGVFLSDLHLHSGRSDIDRYQEAMHEALSESEIVVLGGDIFDFKWSRIGGLNETIEASVQWISERLETYPHCSFYYLLGNHDCHPKFVSELDALTFRSSNLQWQPYWLKLGANVFLHGDVLDGGLEHDRLDSSRMKHSCDPIPQVYRHWIYDIAVQAKAHRVVATIAKRQNWVLQKLSRYLTDQGLGSHDGVRDVYFGHTHRVIENVAYHGQTFHNGGACIKGLIFRMIPFELA